MSPVFATRMLVSGVAAGVILGLAIGKKPGKLSRLRIRLWPVLIVALVARAIAPLTPAFSLTIDIAAVAITGFVAFANWRIPGAAVIGTGSLLNFLVIVANGGMPVDASQLASIGGTVPSDGLHLALSPAVRFAEFADVIVLAPLRAAYSVGDVLIALGGFLLPFITLTRR